MRGQGRLRKRRLLARGRTRIVFPKFPGGKSSQRDGVISLWENDFLFLDSGENVVKGVKALSRRGRVAQVQGQRNGIGIGCRGSRPGPPRIVFSDGIARWRRNGLRKGNGRGMEGGRRRRRQWWRLGQRWGQLHEPRRGGLDGRLTHNDGAQRGPLHGRRSCCDRSNVHGQRIGRDWLSHHGR